MLVTEVLKATEKEKDGFRLEIDKLMSMKEPVILFGAGVEREIYLQCFKKLGVMPQAFCDNAPEKIGQKVGEVLEILSFEQVQQKYPDAYYYISAVCYYGEIRQQLLDAGISESRISGYDIIFHASWMEHCMEYYQQHEEEIDRLYHMLADEESKKVLRNRLMYLCTYKKSYLQEIRGETSYFEKKLIDFSTVNCFVDLGMYTGDTILEFISISDGQYNKIYGFEPDHELCQTAQNALKKYGGIVFVPMATSDHDGKAQVKESYAGMQTIEDGIYIVNEGGLGGHIFETCTLDTYFRGNPDKIDMIKMDIEGAEMATLRGAKGRIQSDRPILALSVYHKQEDIFTIPFFCKEIVPEYKVYLRHYSDIHAETICYLIPKERLKCIDL
jgi:FkbM family methyltransferase